MRKLLCIAVFTLCSTVGMSQSKAIQIDINEIFAQYENAFNNLTQSYKSLVQGYKKASKPSDVHYYFQSAKKYANACRTYLAKAQSSGEQLVSNSTKLECKEGQAKLNDMQLQFQSTDEKVVSAIESMDAGLATDDIQTMGTHLQAAVSNLQAGVKKLNLAVEQLNGASAELRSCK